MFVGLFIFMSLAAASFDPDEWRAFGDRLKAMFRIHRIAWTVGSQQYLGMDHGDLSRALNGEGKFDWRRVYGLPKDMRATLNFLELQSTGLPQWVQDGQKFAPAINQQEEVA